jgi:hypothetical protein
MLAASLRYWIIGHVPDFPKMLPDSSGIVTVFSNMTGTDIAKDRADNVDAWLPVAVSFIQTSWEKSGLVGRFKLLAPGELRVYPNSEAAAARTWVTGLAAGASAAPGD